MEEIISIKKILELKYNVRSEEIKTIDISNDFEIMGSIFLITKEEKLPMLVIGNNFIGGLNNIIEFDATNLNNIIKNGREENLESIIEEKYIPQDLGVFNRLLQNVELVVSWINPFNYFKSKIHNDFSQMKQFDVIHTNWYYRKLNRKFCFGEEMFLRVHPIHLDIRGFHNYNEVTSIIKYDEKNMKIIYSNNSSPDYIQSPQNDQIISIITSKNKKVTIQY